MGRSSGSTGRAVDPVDGILSSAIDAVLGVLSRSPGASLQSVADQCHAAGLMKLAELMLGLGKRARLSSALKAAYVVSELERSLWLRAR